jgi:hypothetical protein
MSENVEQLAGEGRCLKQFFLFLLTFQSRIDALQV